jgi:hypothetical protein
MAKVERAGVSEPAASGETLERKRRRRKLAILALVFVLAFPVGFAVGFTEADDLLVMDDRWPPALAMGLSLAYLFLVIGGAIALSRQVDEVERTIKYKAVGAAATAYVIVYPVWFFLWKGGFVPEPMHVALYAGFLIVFLLASLFYRFR